MKQSLLGAVNGLQRTHRGQERRVRDVLCLLDDRGGARTHDLRIKSLGLVSTRYDEMP